MAAVASPSSRNQTPSSSCSFSYPFASYTSGNFAPEPPPRPHALLLLLWPPSGFFFHLFATVFNIVIHEILLGATTRLPRTTLHSYKEVQIEPTSSWALLRKDFAAPSKYTGIFQASKDIFREEGFQDFWRGNVPALLMVMPYTAIQFRVLHKLKTLASGSSKSEDHSSLSPYLSYVSGALAGCVATIGSYLFDLLRTILASQGEPKI